MTGSGLSVFESARSARGVTTVCSVSELFPLFGSEVLELTEAVLPIVPPSLGAVAATVIEEDAPEARLARVQLIWPPEGGLQVQPVPEALAAVTPVGSVSVTVNELAASGPALLMLRV